MPDGDQEDAKRKPAQRRGDEFDFAAIIGLGDQHAGDQRAEDRAEADRAGGEAGEDHDEQADREEQFGALGPRRLREQMREQQAPGDEHRDDHQRALPRHGRAARRSPRRRPAR